MNIGNCCICMSAFKSTEVAVLNIQNCAHTFHYECISNWIKVKEECPLCRHAAAGSDVKRLLIAAPVPDNIHQKALADALACYDQVAPGSKEDSKERQMLFDTLTCLISTIEDEQQQEKTDWESLKKFLKIAGTGALLAVLVFLCYLYGPLIAGVLARSASWIFDVIGKLGGYLRQHFPEIVKAAMVMMAGYTITKSVQDDE